MNKTHTLLLALLPFCAIALPFCAIALGDGVPTHNPVYTSDGRLVLPEDYRTWIYLTSGFDMAYSAQAQTDHHMFDNVFVEPSAYRVFLATGAWPDKTMLMLEVRGAKDKGSINKSGHFQGTEVMGREIHVKDSARFPDQWAFFAFEETQPAKVIPRSAACYACHAEHAAVDTTFVQFYPTLLPVAQTKGTLATGYKAELSALE